MYKYYNTVLKTVLTIFCLDHVSGLSISSILFLVRSRKARILILFSISTTILLVHFDFGCEIFDATFFFDVRLRYVNAISISMRKYRSNFFFRISFSKIANPVSRPPLPATNQHKK